MGTKGSSAVATSSAEKRGKSAGGGSV